MPDNNIRFVSILITLVFFILISCDSRTIDPFEDQQGVYSVYGALEVGSSTNYVRVRKLDTALLADSTAFDGTVSFTHLDSGFTTTLQDSIVNFDGNYTHNFLVEYPIEHNNEYLIRVESSDGDITESVATAPGVTSYQLSPDPFSSNVSVSCNTEIEYQFNNVIQPEFVRMDIGFNHNGRMNWSTLDLVDQLEHNEAGDQMSVTMSPNDMLIEVFTPPLPDNPFLDLRTLTPTVRCSQLNNRSVYIRYYHLGNQWDEGLPFRSGNIQMETDVISNGLGFFGVYFTETFVFPFSVN